MTLFKHVVRAIFILCCTLLIAILPGVAQDAVPTLPVPTPVPQPDTGAGFVNLTESSLARVAREGRVRVGILFNEPPFGELSITGEVEGFDAALATTIAGIWGVEVDFVQVTRLNAMDMLQRGQVDMLMAAMVHQRNLDARLQFTQSYRVGRQAMMVMADSDLVNPVNASGRRIAYVAGTDSDRALQDFLSTTGLTMQLQPYLTLDSAFVALFAGNVDGLVGRETHLLQVAEQHLDEIKMLDTAIQPESYAIAVHPRDIPLRQYLNQTLQAMLLSEDQKLDALYDEYFPGVDLPYDA
ncbi:MAG: substrate-binding periplasmic protein, partial [Aggregatilineales bacterium]